MERGQLVKPSSEALRLTQFRERSRLRVRRRGSRIVFCRACEKEWKARRPNAGPLVWSHEARIQDDLFAAGKEVGSNLCLGHVVALAPGDPLTGPRGGYR